VTDSTALTRLNIDEMARVSKALSESQRFGSIQAQAVFVSVLAGQELGIPPFAAMTGINVIQGKPVLGSGVLAGLVKASPKYDYRVQKHTSEECVIAFFEHGDHVGDSAFTMDDAKRAGLVRPSSPWITYPKNMLFARALSNGVAFFAPDVTMSRIYVEGEIEESLPTPPPPAPRDVVAVVEAEQALPVESASSPAEQLLYPTPDQVRSVLRDLDSKAAALLKQALVAAGVEIGSTRGELVAAICGNITEEQWVEVVNRIVAETSEAFPDSLADVQNTQPEKERPSAIEKRDGVDAKADAETEAMFGEAYAQVASVPAYGENAAS
jgi:hypothetical protein